MPSIDPYQYHRPTRPAPVRPHETIVSAPLQYADGPRPAVLLTSRPIYLVTGRYADASRQAAAPRILGEQHATGFGPGIGIDSGAGHRAYPLAPGRIVIARRDALTLPAWRRILSGEE